MEIKDILKNRLLELNLTMKEVSDAVGVSEATISRWESGDIENMKRSRIYALSRILKISPLVIMGMEAPSTENQYAENIGLDATYFSLAKELQDAQIDPEDIRNFAKIIKKNSNQ